MKKRENPDIYMRFDNDSDYELYMQHPDYNKEVIASINIKYSEAVLLPLWLVAEVNEETDKINKIKNN